MKIHYILIVIVAISCSGCGTFIGRSGVRDIVYQEKIPEYYPATYCDGVLIGQSFTTEKNHSASVGTRCIVCVGSVIDLPISIVLDTLLLPLDASNSSEQKTSSINKSPQPTNVVPTPAISNAPPQPTPTTNAFVRPD
jgi:uncharacterized protein YceK